MGLCLTVSRKFAVTAGDGIDFDLQPASPEIDRRIVNMTR